MHHHAHTTDIPHYEILKTLQLFHDVKNGLGLYIGRENTESRRIRVSRGWHDSFTYIYVSNAKSRLAQFNKLKRRKYDKHHNNQ